MDMDPDAARDLLHALVCNNLIKLQKHQERPGDQRLVSDARQAMNMLYSPMVLEGLDVEQWFMDKVVEQALDGRRVSPGLRRPLNGANKAKSGLLPV